ncbi:MAG TPA: hypothetical protein VIR78_07945 [Malonomonas sp.]
MIDNFFYQRSDDRCLELNSEVIVCWTDRGYSYSTKGIIISLTREKARIRLLEDVASNSGYRRDTELEVARFADQTCWSEHNCVRPANPSNALAHHAT